MPRSMPSFWSLIRICSYCRVRPGRREALISPWAISCWKGSGSLPAAGSSAWAALGRAAREKFCAEYPAGSVVIGLTSILPMQPVSKRLAEIPIQRDGGERA